MLVADPKQRAGLREIMNHPWITKGFGCPPDNYVPHREPLQLPADPEVIQGMTAFGFGSPEYITTQLTEVIESDDYQNAVWLYLKRPIVQPPGVEKKRRFAFGFCGRWSSETSRDTLTNPSTEGLDIGTGPINAFHPLISVYYLVLEKQERGRKATNPKPTSNRRVPREVPFILPSSRLPSLRIRPFSHIRNLWGE